MAPGPVASNAAAITELVAPQDRARVLFEPTPEGIEQALRRALADGEALQPVRAAFEEEASLRGWGEVVSLRPRAPVPASAREQPSLDVVVVHRSSREALARCLSALERQREAAFTLTVALAGGRLEAPADLPPGAKLVRSEQASVEAARALALESLAGEWVLFLDEEDVPEEALLELLLRAQAASDADVVSCGLFLEDETGERTLHFFPGEPGALGLLANGYGNVALLRRSRLGPPPSSWPVEGDPDWPLLARLNASGAKVVSIPLPLVTRRARPGSIERHPSDALLVIEELERGLPDCLRSLPRLAAGLAAAARGPAPVPARRGVRGGIRRLVKRLR